MTVVAVVVGRTNESFVLHHGYVEAVVAAGGVPLLVPATGADAGSLLERSLEAADALLLAGGGDIDPARYGAATRTTLDHVDPVRDEIELRAIDWAQRSEARILGICRGAQMLAVAGGGTLVQDLPAAGFSLHVDVGSNRRYAGLRHVVKSEPGSLADQVLGGMEEVNSHHHQAVLETGDLVSATAWSDDGVIEAVEGPNVLGIQWHPEVALMKDDRYLRPFQWLTSGEAAWTP